MKKNGSFVVGLAFAALAFLGVSSANGAQVPQYIVDKAMSLMESDYLLYDKTTPEACRSDIEAMLSQELAFNQGENPPKFSHEMACLDPYSGVFAPQQTRERNTQFQGLFGGIGLSYKKESSDSNRGLVIEVFEGNPAQKAGVKPGDVLLRARNDGEENFVDLPDIQRAADTLRGRVGSKVYLVVRRDGVEITLPVMTREVIVLKAVKAKVFHGFGYVSISSFTEQAADELDDALISFEKQGISRVVIDLRDNPGGLLGSAIEMLYSFSSRPEDVMLTTRSRHEETVFSIRSPYPYCSEVQPPCLPFAYLSDGSVKMPGRFENLAIAILVNGNSASASEIFAGTMKDWSTNGLKVRIVGTTSFGKGIVQSIIPLGDGYSLSLTTAEYFAGNGKTPVHHIGVTPYYIVDDTRQSAEDTVTEKDEQFWAAVFVLTSLLD